MVTFCPTHLAAPVLRTAVVPLLRLTPLHTLNVAVYCRVAQAPPLPQMAPSRAAAPVARRIGPRAPAAPSAAPAPGARPAVRGCSV